MLMASKTDSRVQSETFDIFEGLTILSIFLPASLVAFKCLFPRLIKLNRKAIILSVDKESTKPIVQVEISANDISWLALWYACCWWVDSGTICLMRNKRVIISAAATKNDR